MLLKCIFKKVCPAFFRIAYNVRNTNSIEYKGPKILFVESLRICRNSKM